jgi:hypothetical protein
MHRDRTPVICRLGLAGLHIALPAVAKPQLAAQYVRISLVEAPGL